MAEPTKEETVRIERAMTNEHYEVGKAMVYCPEYGKNRPWSLCAREHGDYDPYLDEEPKGAD